MLHISSLAKNSELEIELLHVRINSLQEKLKKHFSHPKIHNMFCIHLFVYDYYSCWEKFKTWIGLANRNRMELKFVFELKFIFNS